MIFQQFLQVNLDKLLFSSVRSQPEQPSSSLVMKNWARSSALSLRPSGQIAAGDCFGYRPSLPPLTPSSVRSPFCVRVSWLIANVVGSDGPETDRQFKRRNSTSFQCGPVSLQSYFYHLCPILSFQNSSGHNILWRFLACLNMRDECGPEAVKREHAAFALRNDSGNA